MGGCAAAQLQRPAYRRGWGGAPAGPSGKADAGSGIYEAGRRANKRITTRLPEAPRAAVGPVVDVMAVHVTSVRAAREAAAPIPRVQRTAQRRRNGAGATPDVQRFAGIVLDDSDDAGIARQPTCRLDVMRRAVPCRAEGDAALPVGPMRTGLSERIRPTLAAVELGDERQPVTVGSVEVTAKLGDLGSEFAR